MNETVRQGITALKAGDRNTARQRLITAVRETPDDIDAWLWLSAAMDRDHERLDCLRHVLRIDPHHELAQRGVQQILQRQASEKENSSPPTERRIRETLPPTEEKEEMVESVQEEEPMVYDDRLNSILGQAEPAKPVIESGQVAAMPSITPPLQSAPTSQQPVETQIQPARVSYRIRKPYPFPRGKQNQVKSGSGSRIFKTHPSLTAVMAMVIFVFFGSMQMVSKIQAEQMTRLFLAIAVIGVMYLFLFGIFIRIFTTTYEMTSLYLSIPHHGKRTLIPLQCILGVTTHQGLLQKLNSSGDILIEAIVDGRITRVGLRDVAKFHDYANQIDMLSSKARA